MAGHGSFPSLSAGIQVNTASIAYRTASVGVQGGIRAVLVAAALERGMLRLSRRGLRVFHSAQDLARASSHTLRAPQVQRLMDSGVVFATGSDIVTGEKTFIALYEDAILARGTAKEVESSLKPLADKRGEKLAKALSETSKKATNSGDITKSFFANAKITLTEIKPLSKVFGQSEVYTCAATSLKMALEDLGVVRSEEFLAKLLKTNQSGANILDIPNALKSANYLDTIKTISRGTKADKTVKLSTLESALKSGDKRAIVSVWNKDFGGHAIIVDKIENGYVYIRDPLPIYVGSSYVIKIHDFIKVFNRRFVTLSK
jgi:hypothetical protein